MKLSECLEKMDDINSDWPNGFNFKNKSEFIGISNGDFVIPRELLISNNWSYELKILDKELIKELDTLLGDQEVKP